MEITKEMLIANETVLVTKKSDEYKCLYLGCVPNLNIHFVSVPNKYREAYAFYTIEEINQMFTIKQPESKVVPLEKKVYDFVPVRVRDSVDEDWKNAELCICVPQSAYPYSVVLENNNHFCGYKYCEFI